MRHMQHSGNMAASTCTFFLQGMIANTESNDLRIITSLRKYEITVERISVSNVIKKMMEPGIHCLPCSYTNDVINMLP